MVSRISEPSRVATEHGPFEMYFPIEHADIFLAMLDYQRVYYNITSPALFFVETELLPHCDNGRTI